ncbi:MAG: type II secretion system protein GspI [Candidatus Contendobacter odensis]|uniref:Type II secretion system protein I n=1 Tax=Candidatus Contendibacter odensensis TaxID=1400860 RepID=A0A2G6PFS9_9GAMM|nr:MAG: type II secretion system protein GspI [Candidatus Contendobacter odensis]
MKRIAGFTLLEVLVALAVLAIAMGAIIHATTQSIANTYSLREQTFARWVASNTVNSFLLDPAPWPEKATRKGDVELANRTWRWEARFSETDDEDLSQLKVNVYALENAAVSSTLIAFRRRSLTNQASKANTAVPPPPK